MHVCHYHVTDHVAISSVRRSIAHTHQHSQYFVGRGLFSAQFFLRSKINAENSSRWHRASGSQRPAIVLLPIVIESRAHIRVVSIAPRR
jgi:hypothetical protein